MVRFEALVAEGAAEPTEGWDFSWFEGRATEARPSWRYAALLSSRAAAAAAVLDVQTGGGEVLATVAEPPPKLVATEAWLPNVELARCRLAPLGASVVAVGNEVLPFAGSSFDLIVSRHPVTTAWEEIGRVLRPGASYLSQQVGRGSNRELTDFLMGPQPVSEARSVSTHVARAEAAGLELVDLREESLPVTFHDVGAVVYFLRKVLWTVPGFSVEWYRGRLLALHEQIESEGPFVSHAARFLIEVRRPPA
ncbi:MAG TPA: methyltransferase domain-containing protein [Acidimicrobiales bacterium]|nr:methyltransferase domain-containing protein [Acidimicrobiales bacterium]